MRPSGQLHSSASYAAAGNAASIVVSAGGVTAGAILSNADGQTNLVTTGANARVSLDGQQHRHVVAARVGEFAVPGRDRDHRQHLPGSHAGHGRDALVRGQGHRRCDRRRQLHTRQRPCQHRRRCDGPLHCADHRPRHARCRRRDRPRHRAAAGRGQRELRHPHQPCPRGRSRRRAGDGDRRFDPGRLDRIGGACSPDRVDCGCGNHRHGQHRRAGAD